MNKKGMSGIVVTLIIIGIALAAVGIVFYVINVVTEEQSKAVTDASSKVFQNCEGAGYVRMTPEDECSGTIRYFGGQKCCMRDSSSSGKKSCLELLNAGFTENKVYLIDPDGVGGANSFDVYCDMTRDGGGWTLAAVCRPEDNPNYPNYNSGVPYSDCWNTGKVGDVLNPISSTTTKLSDENIITILSNGEKTTRGHWKQTYRYNGNNPVDIFIYNKITNPSQWSSNGGGTTNKEFYVKYNYEDSWGSPLLTYSSGCASASNGWSNQNYGGHGESCGSLGAWNTGCEKAPSSSHCCACVTYDERADLVVYIR